MTDDYGFSIHRRGSHRLAGRTILQLVGSLEGEADAAAIHVAGALAEAGARPLVACPSSQLISELQARGGVWLDFPSGGTNPLAMLLAYRRLKAMLAAEQVDLVHARSRAAGWLALGACRSAGLPFVTSFTQISSGQSLLRQRYGAAMAKGDMVIASSRYAMATIQSVYSTPAERLSLVRPGLDLRALDARAIDPSRVQKLRRAWEAAPDQRIVLLVARPSIWKGHRVLLDAVKHLVDEGMRDLKLVFVGANRGGESRDIDAAIKAGSLTRLVHRTALCEDMPAALLAASVVVVPSIEPETVGRIAVEAQAVGTPVIVSDLGALPETVQAPPDVEASKRTGWRVSPSDPRLLADALREVLSLGASGRDALADRSRRQAERRFSVDRMTRETLDCYGVVLDRAGEPG